MRFKKPANSLEGQKRTGVIVRKNKDEKYIVCENCKKSLSVSELKKNLSVCDFCSHHFRIGARERINLICDDNTFIEIDKELTSKNILDFEGYDEKLERAVVKSGENEGVICGTCEIENNKCMIFAMDPDFMMGSMGSVVGEKITRLFEKATDENMPVVGFCVSGGARMQEGIISLMQMAKTSGAVKIHSDSKNLFLCILTNPTTGGVTASFAMQGDIIISEPNALIGFAGPRVIEQTIKKKLSKDFQRAEFLLDKGFLDDVIDRRDQKEYIKGILKIHTKEAM